MRSIVFLTVTLIGCRPGFDDKRSDQSPGMITGGEVEVTDLSKNDDPNQEKLSDESEGVPGYLTDPQKIQVLTENNQDETTSIQVQGAAETVAGNIENSEIIVLRLPFLDLKSKLSEPRETIELQGTEGEVIPINGDGSFSYESDQPLSSGLTLVFKVRSKQIDDQSITINRQETRLTAVYLDIEENFAVTPFSSNDSFSLCEGGSFEIQSPSGILDADPSFTWSQTACAVSYRLQISENPDCTQIIYEANDLDGLTHNVSDLPSGSYFSCVSAKDSEGRFFDASNQGLGFDLQILDPFGLMEPSGLINRQPSFIWSRSSQAQSYHILVGTGETCLNPVIDLEISGDTRLDINLAFGSYHTCITAVSTSGQTLKATNDGLPFTLEPVCLGGVINNFECQCSGQTNLRVQDNSYQFRCVNPQNAECLTNSVETQQRHRHGVATADLCQITETQTRTCINGFWTPWNGSFLYDACFAYDDPHDTHTDVAGECDGKKATLICTSNEPCRHDPQIQGEVILGTSGNDEIYAGAGDVVCGGDGDDIIYGEFGSIHAETQSMLSGGRGDDTIYGARYGGDLIYGGSGDDIIHAAVFSPLQQAPWSTRVYGSSGDDTLYGNIFGDTHINAGFGSFDKCLTFGQNNQLQDCEN